nr:FRG domain-containing protein [Leifsonia sp. Leaf325]
MADRDIRANGDESASGGNVPPGRSPSEIMRIQEILRALAANGAQQALKADPDALARMTSSNLRLYDLLDASHPTGPGRGIDNLSEILDSVAGALSPDFWRQFAFTRRQILDSASVDSFYSNSLLAAGKRDMDSEGLRPDRTAEAFFGEHSVEISDVASLLKAFAAVQSKQHRHRPIWRGQQDATWPVHSSLFRRLGGGGPVHEDQLVAAEVAAVSAAIRWGLGLARPLEFLATLQHHGAPTRLIDVTVDPELAAWFAVEADPDFDDSDGLVIGWGRVPVTKGGISDPYEDVLDEGGSPFWHAWETDEDRHRVDWGTGTKTWTWFPPALNERMRAQRAGFLFEAGPILTTQVTKVFTDTLSQDWRAAEVARATSIVGLPSRHDVLTKPNAANLVPIFSFRIFASAKKEIRDYLEQKGLTSASVYPDLGGLVRHLSGPHGP